MKKTAFILTSVLLAATLSFPVMAEPGSRGDGSVQEYSSVKQAEKKKTKKTAAEREAEKAARAEKKAAREAEKAARAEKKAAKDAEKAAKAEKKAEKKAEREAKQAAGSQEQAEITYAGWNFRNGKMTASWIADRRKQASFTVTLYHEGSSIAIKTVEGKSKCSFAEEIFRLGKTGSYSFTVKAVWQDGHTDEKRSDSMPVNEKLLQKIGRRLGRDSSAAGKAAQ